MKFWKDVMCAGKVFIKFSFKDLNKQKMKYISQPTKTLSVL